ncbi:MAG: carbohydrate-binding protein [Fibrobacteraceae bacterium]|nr:carbohydrate-binding protein [Fibrobacteraceae bacterium]
MVLVFAVGALAKTNQFRGVNWADKRDNFVSDVLVLSGLSTSDNYETTYKKADRIVGQFVKLMETNSVRMPVNEPTILKAWDYYRGAIDGALSYGRVDLGYWGPAQPSGPKNMDDWWAMWKKIVGEYGENPNVYFELFNEPHMYNKDELRSLYAKWLETFPNVPREHIILDGSGMAQYVPDIADDSRFDGCLFAVHEYTFWNMSITTEKGWRDSFKGKVGKYADRTVVTEWGGAMGPGDKAGVHYEMMDYNDPNPTNYFMAYIRGMSEQIREWEMGSFYWPGLRDGDWYSMTQRRDGGDGLELRIVNQSGIDRMQYSWTDTVPAVQEPFGDAPLAIPGKIQAEDYDKGGNGVSYYDKVSKNQGGLYREDYVDIVGLGCGSDDEACKPSGYAVGYTESGEWLEYTVKVAKKASYEVQVAMATSSEKAGVLLYLQNKVVGDSLFAKQGEDWETYTAVSTKVELDEGEAVLKMLVVGNYVNIDWINFCEDQCEAATPVDSDTSTNLIHGYSVDFGTNKTYGVYDSKGRFLGVVSGANAMEVREKVHSVLRYRGAFRVK